MTSNQIAYWRDQETRRANLAKEDLTAREQALTSRKLDIEELMRNRELDIKQQEALQKFAADVARYGWSSMQQLPQETLRKYPELFKYKDADAMYAVNDVFQRLGQMWSTITGGLKSAAALF